MTHIDLHHVSDGCGPPLLLLHGFPQTHISWDAVIERLGSELTLVRPDLRGYGASLNAGSDFSSARWRPTCWR